MQITEILTASITKPVAYTQLNGTPAAGSAISFEEVLVRLGMLNPSDGASSGDELSVLMKELLTAIRENAEAAVKGDAEAADIMGENAAQLLALFGAPEIPAEQIAGFIAQELNTMQDIRQTASPFDIYSAPSPGGLYAPQYAAPPEALLYNATLEYMSGIVDPAYSDSFFKLIGEGALNPGISPQALNVINSTVESYHTDTLAQLAASFQPAENIRAAYTALTESRIPANTVSPVAAQSPEEPVDTAALLIPAETTVAQTQLPESITEIIARPVDYTEAADRILQIISELKQNGTYELKMKLIPENLGEITLKVVMRGNTVNVGITTDNAAAQRELIAQSSYLREALETHGMNLNEFDIANGQRGDPGNGSQRQRNDDSEENRRLFSAALEMSSAGTLLYRNA